MKKKVLIVFKYPHRWNNQVIKKFSNYYDTEKLYISDLKNINFKEVVNKISDDVVASIVYASNITYHKSKQALHVTVLRKALHFMV